MNTMKHRAAAIVLLLLLVASIAQSQPTGFMKGISGTSNVSWLSQVHATHCRRYVFWRHYEPELNHLDRSLTVDALRQDPKSGVYEWAARHIDWRFANSEIDTLLAIGVKPVIEVGEGTHYGLPKFNGTLADPGVIGEGLYLAYQYRFTRAVAHHFKQRGVQLFQIENELNEAYLAGIYGQRLMTKPWGNWTFLTSLLSTLRQAVKDEDSSLQVTMNFHTDVPEVVHDILHMKGFYVDAVKDWAPLLDVIAYDAYPNMYVAYPSLGHLVGERAKIIAAATNNTKKVFVMETGYPVNADTNQNAPAPFNFTESAQAEYTQDVYSSLTINNSAASGLFVFQLTSSTGMTPPPGGYTAKDESMFNAIKAFLMTQNVDGLLKWVLEPGDLGELLKRASVFMGMPDGEGGWGLVDAATHTPRPAFKALATLFGP